MLACTALVGCTNNDDIVNNNESNDGLKNFVTKVSVNFPDINNNSRAVFNNGDPMEYNVESIVVKFYDANKTYLGDGTTGTWTTNTNGNTVTRTADVTFRSVSQPYYAVAFVNDPTTPNDLQQKTIAEMKEVKFTDSQISIATAANLADGKFFMTNSSYVDGGEIVQEVNVSESTLEILGEDDFNTVKASAAYQGLPAADIYVERVVAKVNLGVNLGNSGTNQLVDGEEGLYKLKYVDTGGNEKDKFSNYAIKVVGWGLNATNKNFYALKKIEKNWGTAWYGTGRSFWAIDDNYSTGTYLSDASFIDVTEGTTELTDDREASLSLNYYTLDEIAGTLDAPQYCYENTTDAGEKAKAAFTHVVLKAQYYEENTTTHKWAPVAGTDYIYRINQTIYNATSMKTLVANVLMSKYDFFASTDATTPMDAAEVVNKVNLDVDANDVNAVASINLAEGVVAKKKDGTTANIEDWTEEFNGGKIIGYKGGFCYYTIPIKHFDVDEGQLGHYGVVRNHWYDLSVTSIAGFGEPGSSDPIIPEDEEELKDWIVKCNININAWSKVTQGNITVGGGNSAWD